MNGVIVYFICIYFESVKILRIKAILNDTITFSFFVYSISLSIVLAKIINSLQFFKIIMLKTKSDSLLVN